MALGASIQPPRLILGSASPRRKSLLEALGLHFEVRAAHIDETYPPGLSGVEIPEYLATRKAMALSEFHEGGTLVLTADTIVWHQGKVLEKPAGVNEARDTLRELSGMWHEVITSVCFSGKGFLEVKHARTEVKFMDLDQTDIETYLRKGHPLDKAGAYGIQEWIGLVGVEEIRGSYTNVVGLPTQVVYKTLRDMAGRYF
ncbi:Maf family nucleotide pyrophosphatase [Robiginitalea marina]|uniref:dTTP/UTP pyrophosphatase n=1 Tax=Robiginitalea marina TaxID=2954105 RepID=A0ABT1AU57_9FLAO|nr:Maf family nucleotide pyrophosphatase [Robiginitalea marina]MCO5723386.1 Maf family nucleotide pyrophosphatase [Robiginitalea marina]